MILTCPQCTTRFLLSANALMPDGRRVKCSSCGEIWFQKPDPEELEEGLVEAIAGDSQPEDMQEEKIEDEGEEEGDAGDSDEGEEGIAPIEDEDLDKTEEVGEPEEEDDFSYIPKAVVPEEFEDSDTSKEKNANFKSIVGMTALAACLFGLSFSVLVIMKDSLVREWPESVAMYNLFGVQTRTIGDGIVFDRVTASQEGDTVKLEGMIINLTSKDQLVPYVEAHLRDDHGEVLEKWAIPLDHYELKSEEDIKFSSQHKTKHQNAQGVLISFVLSLSDPNVKIASADAHNTEAQHQDDHAHQSDDAKVSESPEHASSPHH